MMKYVTSLTLLLLALVASLTAPHASQAMCIATELAPTHAEGARVDDSCDLAGNKRGTQGTLGVAEDETNQLVRTSGGKVRQTVMASAVTTNTTSAASDVPTGSKTIKAVLTGTGAITQTIAIYGSDDNTYTAAVDALVCTLTLSGTTAVGDTCPVVTANFSYWFVVTTNTTGTSASGAVYAMY